MDEICGAEYGSTLIDTVFLAESLFRESLTCTVYVKLPDF